MHRRPTRRAPPVAFRIPRPAPSSGSPPRPTRSARWRAGAGALDPVNAGGELALGVVGELRKIEAERHPLVGGEQLADHPDGGRQQLGQAPLDGRPHLLAATASRRVALSGVTLSRLYSLVPRWRARRRWWHAPSRAWWTSAPPPGRRRRKRRRWPVPTRNPYLGCYPPCCSSHGASLPVGQHRAAPATASRGLPGVPLPDPGATHFSTAEHPSKCPGGVTGATILTLPAVDDPATLLPGGSCPRSWSSISSWGSTGKAPTGPD